MTDEDVVNLYRNWEAAIKVHGIARWMYDQSWTQGLEFADSTVVDRLRYFNNTIMLSDEEFAEYVSYIEQE